MTPETRTRPRVRVGWGVVMGTEIEGYETRIRPFVLALHNHDYAEWSRLLRSADVDTLIELFRQVSNPGQEGHREATRSMIDAKLAEQTVREMRRLEVVGIGLAFVGLLVAIPSAVSALHRMHEWGWW